MADNERIQARLQQIIACMSAAKQPWRDDLHYLYGFVDRLLGEVEQKDKTIAEYKQYGDDWRDAHDQVLQWKVEAEQKLEERDKTIAELQRENDEMEVRHTDSEARWREQNTIMLSALEQIERYLDSHELAAISKWVHAVITRAKALTVSQRAVSSD